MYTAGSVSNTWRLGASLATVVALVFAVSACIPLRPVTYDPAPIVCEQAKSLHGGRIGFLNASENFSLASEAGIFLDEEFPGPFVWDRIQPSFGAPYAFNESDAIVQRAQIYGFSLTGILWPYAEWDQKSYGLGTACRGGGYSQSLPPHRCRPDDDDAYSDFVYQVVERYDGDGLYDMEGLCNSISRWEVIATPSRQQVIGGIGTFRGEAVDYFNLLRVTYEGVKDSCPQCDVQYGALDGTNMESLGFLEEILRLGGAEFFDAVSLHSTSSHVASDITRVIALLESYHHPKPIWVTRLEAEDAPTFTDGLIKGMTEAFAAGAEQVYYPLLSSDARVVPEQNRIALIDVDGGPTSAYRVLQSFIQKLGKWESAEMIAPGRYRFDRKGDVPLYIVWEAGGEAGSTVNVVSGDLRVTELDGTMETKNVDGMLVTAEPIYIE
ncbi:MAG: hypothetical protein V1685_05845 [Parcubacteria group bacterium]